MNHEQYQSKKAQALKEFGVQPTELFDAKKEIQNRVDYLKTYVRDNNLKSIVLGISGGVDSFTAGKLAQQAMQELRNENYEASFIAVRLPAGVQLDELEARESIKLIGPDKTHTINIGACANMLSNECVSSFGFDLGKLKPNVLDFHKGNIKARLRMTAQYHLAGMYQGVVLGTDHNAEGVLSFYTKYGDGGCDLIVLNGLNKRQVRLCAKELGAPEWLYNKPATADLEELNEHLLDEDSTGIPYDVLDDFLEGQDISYDIEKKIIQRYVDTEHKRHLPVCFV